MLFATMHRARSMDKSARADFCLSADQVCHDAEDFVGEVTITEDVALAEARSEDGDDDWRLLICWVALGEFAYAKEKQ